MRVIARRQVCSLTPRLREAVEKVKACTRESNSLYGCPRERVDQIMRDAGAALAGVGVNRYGYTFEDEHGNGCVVKVPRADALKGDNIKEAEVYRSLPPMARLLFAPVGEADPEGYWETQERAELETIPPDERLEIRDELRRRLGELGYVCGDLHVGNVGRLRGHGVIVNYGYELQECPIPQAPI